LRTTSGPKSLVPCGNDGFMPQTPKGGL